MNAPVLLAQLSGSTQTTPPKILKIAKPANAEALSFHLDGNTRLDFSDIASEKLTFVKVGEKLIVLFDNQSTVTIDPVFDSASGNPLADIGFQVGDRTLDGTEFAALFPIGTDQSVLPAAGGNASGPTGGANFSDAQVTGLGPGGNPLALLGDEQFGGPEFGSTEPGLAQIGVGTAVVGEIDDEGLSDGIEGGPGDAPGNATSVINASLNLNFGTLGTSGATLAFLGSQPELSGLTSGGEPINLLISNPAGGTPTIIGFVGFDPNAPGSHVFEITLGLTTNTGEYSFTLLRPLDHPGHGTEDTIPLVIHYSATNAAGTVFPDFTVNVNDDSPDLNPQGFDQPISLDDSPVPHADLKDPASGTSVRGGTLGILWGADNFNDNVDGGVSANTGQNGDRSLIFTNTTIDLSSGETSLTSDLYSHGAQVHFVLQDNGTLLVAYTGDSPTSESTVFTVKLHDTNSGSYVFTQYQELDHVGTSGEEAQPVNLDSLNLTFPYTATDSDGDSINESFSVTVGDDAPTINANNIDPGNVDEDYLPTGNVGDTYNPGPASGDFKFTGNLGVSWGADDNNTGPLANRSLAFSGIVEGNPAIDHDGNAILSHDQAVLLHLTTIGGQPALVGYTGGDADNQSNWVFTVALDDSTSTGSYTFTLLKPIDHPAQSTEDNIQIDFGFTATDADGDTTAASTFHVTINDDAPIQTGTSITGVAAEDDLADFNPLYPLIFDFWQGSLGSSPYDGAGSDQSHTGLLGTVPVWGNLASLVKPGADGPGEFHLVTESQAESVLAHLGPNGGTLSSHGDVINDVRMVDIPNVGEAMGFFASDGRLVFGLFVDASGNYNFRLFDQLDHPLTDDPATAGIETAFKDTLNIDLSQLVTYTDFDKDTITLSAGTFSVNVVDDAPVVVGHEAVTANENDLANFNPLYPLVFDFWQGSLGSSPYDGATDDSSYSGLLGTVTAWGTLADNVRGGADEFGKFELVSETRANEILATLGESGGPLKSHGDVIDDARVVDIPGLGEVMGFFASDGRLVFGLLVTENGTYNFRLFDQLDHAAPTQGPNGAPVADENSLNIDLSKFVTYTDYDHDTVDLGTDTFVVTVVDDIPHVIGSLTVTLDESHLNNFLVGWDLIPAAIKDLYPVEGSSGTNPNADTDFLLNTTSQQGFFDEIIGNNVVHGGADEFGKFSVVSAGRADDLLEGMGIMSKGEAIDHVKLVDIAGLGTVMGFFAGDRVVFTLTVTDAGFYDLRLFDQVDHTGANGTSLNIDLSKFVTYTDFDGDVIDLGTNNLVLTVLDDAPVPVTGAQVFGTVEEEQIDVIGSILGGDMLHGNEDTTSDSGDDHDTSGLGGNLVTSNVTLGSLASLVKVGADENGTFSFDQSIRGIAVVDSTGEVVKSHGQVVTFGFSGNMLIGIANDDGDGILETGNGERVVFSVSLADINPLDNVNNDLFTFTLLDAIDHNNPNGLSTEDLKNLDLSKAIRFTDYDGDSTGFADNSFQIKVIDDTPRQTGSSLKGTVEEEENVGSGTPEMNHGNEDTANEPLFLGFIDQTSNKATGNLGSLVSVGGDEVTRTSILGIPVLYGTFSFGETTNLPVVMSKGQQVQYALSDANGDGLNDTLTGSTADGREVFTLTIVNNTGGGKTAGDYVFTLKDQIDHPDGGGENIANIDFSSVIRFSDYDGDTITLTNGSFSIDVIDDQPVSKGDVVDTDDVLDDEGQGIFTPVNTGGTGDASGVKTVAQGGAKSLFSIGADDLGTITITDKPTFSVLFKNGNDFAQAESVQWRDPVTAADGTVTLTAYSDHYTTVATLVIKIDGSYTFTLNAPVVHPTNQASEEEVPLKFKYTVTDFDKDSVTGSLTINVDDDTPKLTSSIPAGQLDDEAQILFPANNNTVTDDVTNANEAFGNANALFTAGADGVKLVTATPTTFSVIFKDGNGLAGTEAITWSAGTPGPNGETKWIATSEHYDADHPAATLIIRVDGSYKFTLNAPVKNDSSSANSEENLTITIPFKVTDGDGDESSQGTLTIKVNDDTPTVGAQTPVTVDEEGLGGNPGDTYASTNPHDAATSLASTNGTLNYSFGSDGASPTTNVTFLTTNLTALGLKSEGQALTYGWDQTSHTLTASNGAGTVFTLQVTNVLTGAYTFTMSKPLDHLGANSANSEDDITIPFQFTITDGDGDTSATATVNVTINDDAPTFTAGSVENKTVDEEGINGNPGAPDPYAGTDYAGEVTTASGGLGISWGADKGNSGAANRSLAFSGFTEGNPVLNDANVAITSHGAAVKYHLITSGDTQTLVGYIGNDPNNSNNYVFSVTLDDTTTTGTYNFTLFKNLDHPTVNSEDDVTIKFNFIAQDADKDTVAGSFKVTVDDDSPIINVGSIQNGGVDEDNLIPSGNHDSAPGDLVDDGTLVAHGSLGISYGADGPGIGAAANPGITQTFDFTNHSTNIDPYLTVNAHFGVVGNAPVGALGGGQNAPVVITAANGHPFELDSVKLSFAGGPSLTSKITVIAKDVAGQTYTFDVSVANVTSLNGSTPTTFDTTGSPIDGKQLVSVSFGVYGNQAAYVQVDDVTVTRGAAPEVPGLVYFSDLSNAAANVTVTDSDGNNVALNQLTSNGQAVHFALLDSVTLVAYTGSLPSSIGASNIVFSTVLSGTGSGSYDFTLKGILDHPKSGTEDDLIFSFKYTAKDYDGDTTGSSFQVTVDDDMPVITTPAPGENLIVNGQFTDNAGFSPLPWNAQSAPANSDIKGWHIAGNDLERNPANWFVQDPAGGGRVVDLDATPGNVALTQSFTTLQNGQSYTLTFDAAKPVGYDAKTQVFWNGQLVGTITPNSDHFEQFSITVTAGAGTNTLEFREVGAPDNGGTFLANVAMHSTNAIVNEDSLNGNAGGIGDATGTTAFATGALGIKWGADAGDVADGAVQDGTTANSLSDNVAALTGRAVYFTDSNSGFAGLQPSVTALVGTSAIVLHSGGQEVHYQILENGTKLVGYTGAFNVASQTNWVFTVSLSDEGTGQYKFNLLKPLDHPMSGSEDDINLTFDYTARDSDGDMANSTLTITVDDDTPVIGAPATEVNLLTNGDFTGGSFPHAEYWGHWATDGTGWQIAGTVPGQTGVQLELIESGYLGVVTSNGHPMVDLAATPGDVAISQTLNGLTVGQHYTLSFEIGASDPSSAGLQVYWNGNLVGTYHPGQTTAIETLDLTAIAGANTVTFKEIGSPDNTGTYLANVSLVQTSSDLLPVLHANIGEDTPSIITLVNGAHFNFGADGPGAVAFDAAHATMTTPTGTTLGMPTLSYDPVTGNLTIDPAGNFNNLSAGEIATLTVPFTVTDSDGDTVNGIYQFTITGSNDAPVISGTEITARVFEAGGLNSVVTADAASDHRFEPLRNVDTTAAHSIDAGVNTEANMKAVVLAVQAALGTGATMADAIASVWDYLDDLRQSIPDVDQAYYAPLINKATVLLGLVYGEYLQDGGRPLLDVIVKFTPDSNDAGSAPDRIQSLHDNLLGAVDTPSIDDKFSSDPTLLADLKAQIALAGLTDRPIYSGNEGVTNNALGWDLDPVHGFLHASSGQLTATDAEGDALTWSITNGSTYGTMSIDQTGKWTYVLDNGLAQTQALKEGEEVTEIFTATVTDTHGATDTQTVTITIVGTNDAPVASADAEAISDTSAVNAGTPIAFTGHSVLANDTDIDSTALAVISIRAANPIGQGAQEPPIALVGGEAVAHGTYGNLTMHADGTYTYTPNAAFDSIPQGQTVTDVFKYGMVDDHGASTASFLTITITGANDGATITGTDTGNVTEDGTQTANGIVVVSDPDTGDNSFQTPNPVLLLGTYGSFTFNPLSGAWSYTLNNSAGNVQGLHTGDTVYDTLTVTSKDGTDSQTITVTIHGTNDAATITGTSTGSVTEDGTLTTGGSLTVNDVDNGDNHFQTPASLAGQHGTFDFNPNTGAWTYALNNLDADVQALNSGQSLHDTLTVTSFDGSATQLIDVTINGTNDAPVHTTIADASPYYAFSNSAYAASVSQPATINFDADDIFGGGSDTFTFTFTQVYSSTGTNWLTVNTAQGTVTGDPTNLSALTVYRIDAVDTVTHEHTFTYVGFSALPDSNAQYVQITNSASYNNSWMSDVVQVAAGSTVSGTTTITSASGSDVMIGNDNANKLDAQSGNDALYGQGGDDYLYGGGNTAFLSGGSGNDHIYGGGDSKFLLGGAGDDYLEGGHDDVLMGGDGADTIVAGTGQNLIVGGAGKDIITGNSGRDTYVFFEAGDDNVDTISGVSTTTGDQNKDVFDLSYLLESISTDKASHVRFMYSDAGHTTHVLTDPSAIPTFDGDVTIQVNTTGTWQSVATIVDQGNNLTSGNNTIQMMLDHSTIQQFQA